MIRFEPWMMVPVGCAVASAACAAYVFLGAAPGLVLSPTDQARSWSVTLGRAPDGVACVEEGWSGFHACAVRFGDRVVPLRCFAGCRTCRDPLPGECVVRVQD